LGGLKALGAGAEARRRGGPGGLWGLRVGVGIPCLARERACAGRGAGDRQEQGEG